jgi:pimeloyl-ACP methyl ester carboxylesterase
MMLAVPALVTACAVFNLAIGGILRARHPVPGAFYQIGGRSMHLYCTGHGSPTVLLEGGLGDDWLYWQKVQPELAKTTRVCSYDRAGLGWSDLQPGPRDAKNIAAQLHSLLQEAREREPLVLVGASAGGFYVREFAAMYRAETVAVVFVDASVPDQLQERLKDLSPRSRRIIARNSGHHVMIDRPDVVIGGIREVVTEIRSGVRSREDGTTVAQ